MMMLLVVVTIIVVILFMLMQLSRENEVLKKELLEKNEKVIKLTKKIAKKSGKSVAKKEFAKERFFEERDHLIEAKEAIQKIKKKRREDFVYLAITRQILDKYEELIDEKKNNYSENEEIILEKIIEILKNHYSDEWSEEVEV